MEHINSILELKRKHNCNVTQLSKIIDVHKLLFNENVMYDSEFIVDGELFFPKELPLYRGVITNVGNHISRYGTDSYEIQFTICPYNLLKSFMEFTPTFLHNTMQDIALRSSFVKELLLSCRYNEINTLLDLPPAYFDIESYEFAFTEEILICDEDVYNRILDLCVDIKPRYKPIADFWYKHKVRATDKKLFKYLFILRDYKVLEQLKETQYDNVCEAIKADVKKRQHFVASYEFYYTFREVCDQPENLRDMDFMVLNRYINDDPDKSIKRAARKLHNKQGRQFYCEHPSKSEIIAGKYKCYKNFKFNPYILYKIGKYIHKTQLVIKDIYELKYTLFEHLYERNYFLFTQDDLVKHCHSSIEKNDCHMEVIMDNIAKYLHPILIDIHISECKNSQCAIIKNRISPVKRA